MSKLEPTRTYSNPTANDILRRLLDERGVEWWEATPCKTKWNSPIIGGPVAAREWNGEMVLDTGYIAVTPAQAIAATLGSCNCSSNCTNSERTGTCHIKPWKMERDTGFYDCMECECGYVSDVSDWAKWHFCPNCGAKVVEPTTNDVDVEEDE